jgi:hypothetical protein
MGTYVEALPLRDQVCSHVECEFEIVGRSVISPCEGRVDDELVSYGSCLVSQVSPLVHVLSRSVEFEVPVGGGADLGRVGDVVARLTPSPFIASVTVEMVFDPVGGVAPDRPGGKAGGHRAEEFDVPGRRPVERGEDAFGSGPFQAGLDEAKIAE